VPAVEAIDAEDTKAALREVVRGGGAVRAKTDDDRVVRGVGRRDQI
jgi:hypothetical protein